MVCGSCVAEFNRTSSWARFTGDSAFATFILWLPSYYYEFITFIVGALIELFSFGNLILNYTNVANSALKGISNRYSHRCISCFFAAFALAKWRFAGPFLRAIRKLQYIFPILARSSCYYEFITFVLRRPSNYFRWETSFLTTQTWRIPH